MSRTFTEEQVSDFREAFNMFVKDSNNSLSTKELGTVMRSLGQYPTENELQELIYEMDSQGDGFIDFNQFLGLMDRKMKDVDTVE